MQWNSPAMVRTESALMVGFKNGPCITANGQSPLPVLCHQISIQKLNIVCIYYMKSGIARPLDHVYYRKVD